jgi:hypothetical protein
MTTLVVLAVLLSAEPSPAIPPEQSTAPRNAISLELPGLFWSAVELNGERFFADRRLSAGLALGGRLAAQGDYSSYSLALGVQARYWINRFQWPGDLGGPLVGVRLDASYTWVSAKSDGRIMTSIDTSASLRLGYRFVIVGHVEVTLEAGLALAVGIDQAPRLLVYAPRPRPVFGTTLGYLF